MNSLVFNGKSVAIWSITSKGTRLSKSIAEKLKSHISDVTIWVPKRLKNEYPHASFFESIESCLMDCFHEFDGHVFLMATGIVVRLISNVITHKSIDPAVVVMDEAGLNVISLLSGHIGGANALTEQIAHISGANPVISTATDINQSPSIDMIALKHELCIENYNGIKKINMAFLEQKPIWLYDPYFFLENAINYEHIKRVDSISHYSDLALDPIFVKAGIVVDDHIQTNMIQTNKPEDPTLYEAPKNKFFENILILRPPTLAVGIGCNRGTDVLEIKKFLEYVMNEANLSMKSIFTISTIDLKKDEAGLLSLSETMKIPIQFFDKDRLNNVKNIQNPSEIVRKNIGVNSVCEAAAILASRQGKLIISKKKNQNVTIAVARRPFL